jgi:hypothetical protein
VDSGKVPKPKRSKAMSEQEKLDKQIARLLDE